MKSYFVEKKMTQSFKVKLCCICCEYKVWFMFNICNCQTVCNIVLQMTVPQCTSSVIVKLNAITTYWMTSRKEPINEIQHFEDNNTEVEIAILAECQRQKVNYGSLKSHCICSCYQNVYSILWVQISSIINCCFFTATFKYHVITLAMCITSYKVCT